MSPFTWLRRVSPRLSRSRPVAQVWRRPHLECLEDRITPTTFAPTLFSDGVTGNPNGTLRDAILAANADSGTATDTIRLSAGTYTLSIANSNGYETAGKQGDLNITNSNHTLIIEGATDANGKPATVIDQTVADRVFQLLAPGETVTVIFRNIVIEGGNASDEGVEGQAEGSTMALGGGILDGGGNVTLTNVVLQNNQAQGSQYAFGGGIYAAEGSLTIQNSILQNNQARSDSATGGGISTYNVSLTITNSTLQNNQALGVDGNSSHPLGGGAVGGGVYFDALTNRFPLPIPPQLTIVNSTLANNLAAGGKGYAGGNGDGGSAEAGGIFLSNSGLYSPLPVLIVSSTLAGNRAVGGDGGGNGIAGDSSAGGILNLLVPLDTHMINTIVALNSAASAPDYDGAVATSSHNLIGIADSSVGFSPARGDLLGSTANPLNPNLGPLADNGGPTPTMALLPGSPAINAGDNAALSVTGPYDQRGPGFPRLAGAAIDIGAFEYQPPPAPPSGATPTPAAPNLFQAMISLYLDGAVLELANLQFQFVTNLDSFGIVPSVTAATEANAAAAGINFDAVISLSQALATLTGRDLATAQADIHFNLPYAGPFGLFAVAAGAQAALQAVQL